MADTAQRIVRLEPPRRPERLIELDTMGTVGDAARLLSPSPHAADHRVRRLQSLSRCCVLRLAATRRGSHNLLFTATVEALQAGFDSGDLPQRVANSVIL
jgi:hypothetical protein